VITLEVDYRNGETKHYPLSSDYLEDYYRSQLRESLEKGLETQSFAKVWLSDENIITLNMRNVNSYILRLSAD
jgi:hypothetical protein